MVPTVTYGGSWLTMRRLLSNGTDRYRSLLARSTSDSERPFLTLERAVGDQLRYCLMLNWDLSHLAFSNCTYHTPNERTIAGLTTICGRRALLTRACTLTYLWQQISEMSSALLGQPRTDGPRTGQKARHACQYMSALFHCVASSVYQLVSTVSCDSHSCVSATSSTRSPPQVTWCLVALAS